MIETYSNIQFFKPWYTRYWEAICIYVVLVKDFVFSKSKSTKLGIKDKGVYQRVVGEDRIVYYHQSFIDSHTTLTEFSLGSGCTGFVRNGKKNEATVHWCPKCNSVLEYSSKESNYGGDDNPPPKNPAPAGSGKNRSSFGEDEWPDTLG